MPITRISFSSSELLIRTNLLRSQTAYRDASIPATTGKRINKLSDDSSSISRMFSIRNQLANNSQFQSNISAASLKLSFAETQLTSTTDVLDRARNIVLQANNPTVGVSTLSELSTQMSNLKSELLSFANAKQEGRYVFGGTATGTLPFSGTPTVFNGNTTATSIDMKNGLNVQTNIDGQEVFMGNVATSTGSDLVTKLMTNSGGNLGVRIGDTITIAGTVGATAFSTTTTVTGTMDYDAIATAIQTALQANGAGTETAAVQVDGSILVTAAAQAITGLTLSIPNNTAFNTAFTFDDPIGALGTGSSEILDAGDGENIFDLIDDLVSLIVSGDGDLIEAGLRRVESAMTQVLSHRADLGTRQQQIESVEQRLADERLTLVESISNIEDVDIADALSVLSTRETALRLVFAASSQVMSVIGGLQLQL